MIQLFSETLAQGPLLIMWGHVKITPGLRTRIDGVFMKNTVELAFMCEIEETD